MKTTLASLLLCLMAVVAVAAPTIVSDEAGLDAALAGAASEVAFAGDGTITITTTKVIAADLTVDGTGHRVTLSGGNALRVFTVNPGVHLTLRNLTIANGRSATLGGGIYNNGGTVTLVDCTLSGNAAVGAENGGHGSGGAIYNDNGGTLLLTYCTFANNKASGGTGATGGNGADGGRTWVSGFNGYWKTYSGGSGGTGGGGGYGYGGAIYNRDGGVNLTNCTFNGNLAQGGAGGAGGNGGAGGQFWVSTGWWSTSGYWKTYSGGPAGWGGNGGNGLGGGLYNHSGTVTLVNVTMARGTAGGGYGGSPGNPGSYYSGSSNGWRGSAGTSSHGGNIAFASGSVALQNTIVAYGTGSPGRDCSGTVIDNGHNICADASAGFTLPSSRNSVDPLLAAALAANGGSTMTLALRSQSPAFNAGDDAAAPATDQRHFARAGQSDIGAYEGPLFAGTTNPDGSFTITGYTGSGGAVIIPDTIDGRPVTAIGANAFDGNAGLTSIVIPATVTSLGNAAFRQCTNLTGIYFQGNAPALGSDVFYNSTNVAVYYLLGTTGWAATLDGRTTVILERPLITGQPVGATVNVAAEVTLGVTATGTAPFTYQWQKDGVDISGATEASLILNNVQTGDAGSYTAVVTNAYGTTTSDAAVLAVNRVAQTITFEALPAKQIDSTPFAPGATTTSGLPVTYTSSNPAVATVNGSMVTITGLGSTSITASQPGDATYLPAAPVTQNLRVTGLPGTVMTWGYNTSGPTAAPSGLAGVTAIASGHLHTVALKSDGTVTGWGYNAAGQITIPAGLSEVTAIAAGYMHTVALKSDGTVAAWGNNGSGETTVPTGLGVVTAIAAGYAHTVALKSDGTVVAWGNNGNGQTTVPTGLSGVTAIAAGYYHTVALRSDGTVVAWGSNNYGQASVPAGLSGVTAIAAGYAHTVALKSDGTVVAWGYNSYGQTNIPAGLKQVTAIAAGYAHTVALKNDTTVVAWGWNAYGQTSAPVSLNNVTAITAGYSFTVALKSAVTRAAQTISFGSLPDQRVDAAPITLSATASSGYPVSYSSSNPAVAIVDGNTVTITGAGGTSITASQEGDATYLPAASVTRNLRVSGLPGAVVAWGYNGYGQTTVPAGLTNVTAIAAGNYHTVALKSDGTVVAWGYNGYGQTIVPAGLSNVAAIAAGDAHTVALRSDGTVVAWGYNNYGQTTVPAGLGYVTAIAAGNAHTVALRSDGTVVAWGYNGYGQTTVPAGLSNVTAIAAGDAHTVALKSDGTVVAWGNNSYGQTTVPTGLSHVTAIAAGAGYTVARRSDIGGMVVGWGYSGSGQTMSQSGVTGVDAGYAHNVALKGDGTVVAWGNNSYGQTTVPIGLDNVIAIAAGGQHTLALVQQDPPGITAQPASVTVSVGANVTFSVTATGTAPLSYQWQRDGVNVDGATGATVALNSVQTSQAGSYTVVVTNAAGSVTSTAAVLTVNRIAQTISFDALGDIPLDAAPFTLRAAASSGLPVSYTSSNPAVAAVSGNTVTIVGLGTTTLTASQDGDAAYLPATAVGRSMQVVAAASQDYSYTATAEAVTITSYTGAGGAVTIPSTIGGLPVTSIGIRAFQSKSTLTSVTIPASVTTIGDWAFSYCNNLTDVTVPGTVTTIGNYAFAFCSNRTSVTLGDGVTSIGYGAFRYNTGLTSITIPDSVITIGNAAFSFCPDLTALTVGAANPSFSSVNGVLFNKDQTTLLQYPAGSLETHYTVPGTVVVVNEAAFSSCSHLSGVTLPSILDSIGWAAFQASTGLGSISIPDSVTSVAGYAFFGCTNLAVVTLGHGFPSIGQYAFANCTSLTSLTIPANVTSVGSSAFRQCPGLAGIYFQGNAPGPGTDVFYDDTQATVYYLQGATGWEATFAGRPTVMLSPPTITTQPASLAMDIMANATFSVTATGTAPLSYQWRHDGVDVSGATTATLTLGNVQPAAAGNYTVAVTNDHGTVTSDVATLTVNRLAQTISFPALPAKSVAAPPFTLGATASSGLSVSYTSSNPAVATVSGDTVTITGLGTTTFTASQPGDATYLPAAGVSQLLTVTGTASTSLVLDDFAGSAPDAAKFVWSGDVAQTGSGQFNLSTNSANTTWLRSQAGAAPGAGETLVLQMRIAAYAEGWSPGIYGDGQPRGLRVGTDAANVAEFYSISYASVGLRLRKDGVESLATYALPAAGRVDAMHDYEITVTTAAVVFKVDGVVAGTFTTNIPTGALNAYVSTFDGYAGNVPVSIESLSLTLTGGETTATPPAIVTQPTSVTVVIGAEATFSVTAAGAAPLSYQWQHDGADVSGATAVTLTLTDVQPADAGSYTVVVTNAVDSVTSAAAVLTVNRLGQTINFAALPGKSVTDAPFALGATASSGLPVSYTSSNPAVATVSGNTVTIVGPGTTSLTASQIGDATYVPAAEVSQTLTVTGTASTTLATDDFTGTGGAAPDAARFEWGGQVALTGSGQVNLSTDTASTSWLRSLAGAAPGVGETLVLQMRLYAYAEDWNPGVYGNQQPRGLRVGADANNAVEFYSASTTSLGLRVRKDGVESGSVVAFPARVDAMHDYEITVTMNEVTFKVDGNVLGTFTTNIPTGVLNAYISTSDGGAGNVPVSIESLSLTLTGGETTGTLPAITTQPASVSVNVGAEVTFSVTATGTAPLTYQWQHDGADVSGAIAATLTLTGIQSAEAGSYTVVVTNAVDSVISAAAVLTVNRLAQTIGFAALPAKSVADAPFTLGATASSTLPVSYSSSNPAVATVSGATVTITGPGTTTITASQPGDATYAPAADVSQTLTVAGAASAILGSDNFTGEAGAAPDATKFEWGGEVAQMVDGNLGLSTNIANTSWLRSKAGAAPGAGETLVLQMRVAAYAEDWNPGIYGDGQPRGLRVGSDANNVAEFYSASYASVGLRLRKDGVESLATYTLPAAGRVDAMHDYEITVTAASVEFKVDGVVAGTFTTNIPTGALNAYVSTFDGYAGNVPVSIESLSLTLTGSEVEGTPPHIITQPASVTENVGAAATFSVTATGAPPLAYQWSKDGSALSGATGPTLTLTDVQPADAGSYTVVVTNAVDSVTSAAAMLTVNRLAQTISFNSLPGKRVDDAPFLLGATASSGLPVSYNSSNVAVATVSGATVTITGLGTTTLTASQAGDATYLPADDVSQSLIVSGTTGTALVTDDFAGSAPDANKFEWGGDVAQTGSGQFNLSTNTANTSWLRSKAGAAPGAGETLVLQMRLAAYAEPAVYGDGQPHGLRVGSDANNAVEFYSLYGTTLGMRVRKDGIETLASCAFPAGVWSMHDYEITVTTTLVTFKVDGVVTGTFTTNIPTGVLNAYVSTYDGGFGNVPVSIESLSLTLTDGGGGTIPPTVTAQPASVTVTIGADAAFSVAAAGTAPITYQWKQDGVDVGGATAAILTLNDVQTSQAGSYTVVVSNDWGSATSDAAVLTVNRLAQTITFGAPPNKLVTDVPFTLGATAGSGLPVSYTSSDPLVATVSGNTVTITGTGSTTITASQAGDAIYLPADDVSQPLNVTGTGNTMLVTDDFTASAPDADKFEWSGDVAQTGSGQLNLSTNSANTSWLRSRAGAAPGAGETLVLQMRVAAYAEGWYPGIYGDGQPRGLRVGSDANNVAEFYSASYSTVGLRLRKDGVESLATYTLPASGRVDAMHDYEITVTTASVVFKVDGVVAGTFTTNIPTGVLNAHVSTFDSYAGNVPVSIESLSLILQGAATPPGLTAQPAGVTVTDGTTASFSVTASGTPPFTYQWQVSADGGSTWVDLTNDGTYSGVTTADLNVVSTLGLGGYQYRVVVTSSAGTVTSTAAVLTVNLPTLVSIAVTPAIPAVNVGATQLFTPTGTFSDSSTRALTGDWAARGALGTVRASATATLLGNGKVLVAGGGQYAGDSSPLGSTELYNPATGTFSAGASMTVPRKYHTATPLNNGKVLITGGVNMDSGQLSSAELYDPATGTFSATGSMNVSRFYHVATLLDDGKVLITGGFADMNGTTSAELYDPATGTFNVTGAMPVGRYNHTATRLGNGKVLVAGGDSGNQNALASAALYDPATGVFSATGNLAQARLMHAAALLGDGKVLVTGGFIGHSFTPSITTSAELYDPASGTFTATGSLALYRYLHTETLLPNGEVLLVGGGQYPYVSTELYDPASGTFRSGGNMTQTHVYQHTATLLADGAVLITGGGDLWNNPSAVVDLYTAPAAWNSANPAVATVAVDGTATGASPGTTLITATLGGIAGSTTLTVNGISTQPANQTVDAGQNATFSIAAVGLPAPTYQWQVSTDDGSNWGEVANGESYSGATLSNLTVVTSAGMGGYQYRCLVTIGATPITSTAATLTLSTNFSLWQATYFTPLEIADSNVSGPNVVYGEDGLPNLVKYALGFDPKVNITAGLPAVSASATEWIYAYTRPTDRPDLAYAVEISTDLSNWVTTGVTHAKASTVGGLETWEARYPLGSAAKIFFRLRITR